MFSCRAILLLIAATLLGLPTNATAATWFRSFSEPGDYLGAEENLYHDPSNSTFWYGILTDGFGRRSFHLSIDYGPQKYWNIGVTVNSDLPIPGEYPQNNGRTGISVSHNGRGCANYSSMVIKEARYTPAGEIGLLWLTFEYRCFPGAPALRGELRINAGPDMDFFTVTPCRVIDTRESGCGALMPHEIRYFPIASRCGVPVSARAISADITVLAPQASGSLRIYGASQARAGDAVTFGVGRNRSNHGIYPVLGEVGILAIENNSDQPLDFTIDTSGYFH